MPGTKTRSTETGGFSTDERAAMKAHAAELRAEGKNGAKKADGLQALLDAIAKMSGEDRVVAERQQVRSALLEPMELPSDLRFQNWRPMAVDGPERPFCGHGGARLVRIRGRGTRAHAWRRERSGRSRRLLPAGLGARVGDAYTEACLSR